MGEKTPQNRVNYEVISDVKVGVINMMLFYNEGRLPTPLTECSKIGL